MLYQDRSHAGKVLAADLKQFANRTDVLILALPRGGVPVAFEIAQQLNLPMDAFIVRKLGVPGQEELAMGAIASGGARVINNDVVRALKISDSVIDEVAEREEVELERRELSYRSNRKPHALEGMEVILVDDGLATGACMTAAVRAVRMLKAKKIYVAVPVAERETALKFQADVDQIFCAETKSPFQGVGQWYQDFSQTSDAEVTRLLSLAKGMPPQTMPSANHSNR
ncbi:MAG: phosphoribosyltransferase [Candidatus Melainabacteria bacterium]|nr:phosphoribosyltransferase [Candidatus Melainabacteria bacterium]